MKSILVKTIIFTGLGAIYANANSELVISNLDFNVGTRQCEFVLPVLYGNPIRVTLPAAGENKKLSIAARDQYGIPRVECGRHNILTECVGPDNKTPKFQVDFASQHRFFSVKSGDGIAISLIGTPVNECIFVNASEFEK